MRIDVVVVECDETNQEKDDAVRSLMKAHGYVIPAWGKDMSTVQATYHNCWFHRADFVPASAPASILDVY